MPAKTAPLPALVHLHSAVGVARESHRPILVRVEGRVPSARDSLVNIVAATLRIGGVHQRAVEDGCFASTALSVASQYGSTATTDSIPKKENSS